MIRLPISKSIGARWLTASYFAGTLGQCPRLNDCDDLKVIQSALLELELNREWLEMGEPPIDVHASGTAFRFMAAVTASTPGADFLLTGTPRLCSRPMAPLLDVLREAGAAITPRGEEGRGPYRIQGRRLKGGAFKIRGDVSSQFISALMLASPSWTGGMDLKFTTPLVSRPYAEMTADVMRAFGVGVDLRDNGVKVAEGSYSAPRDFRVEADWSAAGFFYEAALLGATGVCMADLLPPGESLQGDARTAGLFALAGVESDFTDGNVSLTARKGTGSLSLDLTDNPDLVPAFAVGCALAGIKFRFKGVANLRVKESDRLEAISTELGRLGYVIETGRDHISWQGERHEAEPDPLIHTYDDHRIAMAFAMAAIPLGRIRIADPEVVEKSFARFWDQLGHLGLECAFEGNEVIVTKTAQP